MKRTIDQWAGCHPPIMTKQSETAIRFALEDAKADILELHAEVQRIRGILRVIAYPRRGTGEEAWDIQEVANLIQSIYTLEQLKEGTE